MIRRYSSYHVRTWWGGPNGVAVRVENVRSGETWDVPAPEATTILRLLDAGRTATDAGDAQPEPGVVRTLTPTMTDAPFVPAGFTPPVGLTDPRFVLKPLGPRHNERDYAAWTSSIDFIRALPGFAGRTWPRQMSLDENRGDLEGHERDFAARTGFTYTVLDPDDGDVIGCLYIYPIEHEPGAEVRSWVRADRASLDVPLAEATAAWLGTAWPFERVRYIGRPDLSR